MGSILSRGSNRYQMERPTSPGGCLSRLFGVYWYPGVQTWRFLRHFRGGYDLRRVQGVEHLNLVADGYEEIPRDLPNCPCPLCYRHPRVYFHSPEPEDLGENNSCFVCARVPVRRPTIKLLFDISFFLKEKGGLEGIIRTPERDRLLERYCYIEWGVLSDWLEYEDETNEDGTPKEERLPLACGWLWKLVLLDSIGKWAYCFDPALLNRPVTKKKKQDAPNRSTVAMEIETVD
ncbi:nef protein [Simian immunodeficiency virus]|uniref:Protein Nef n=1 Tax=Simian immunodeficiency virus TaxID=11723 RepID=V5T8Z1_SIV|nr:nef protein [Simian immunodeficiency virus]